MVINPINNGIVLDHIKAGKAMELYHIIQTTIASITMMSMRYIRYSLMQTQLHSQMVIQTHIIASL